MPNITNVITLKQYAETHKLDYTRVRRMARKNEFPGDIQPFKFGDVWAIATGTPAITLPPKSERGNRRDDGRQRFVVYANTVELVAIQNTVGNDNVIDPRVAAKHRRELRKLADELAELETDVNG